MISLVARGNENSEKIVNQLVIQQKERQRIVSFDIDSLFSFLQPLDIFSWIYRFIL